MATTKDSREPQRSPIKVNFTVFLKPTNGTRPELIFFKSTEEAEAYADECDERSGDDIVKHSFVVDPGSGTIIAGFQDPNAPQNND